MAETIMAALVVGFILGFIAMRLVAGNPWKHRDNEDTVERMKVQFHDYHRWLGEFPAICRTLENLHVAILSRPLGPYQAEYRNVSDLREEMRKPAKAEAWMESSRRRVRSPPGTQLGHLRVRETARPGRPWRAGHPQRSTERRHVMSHPDSFFKGIREDNTVDGYDIETHYLPCSSIADDEGFLRVAVEADGYDIETRIAHSTLIAAGWVKAADGVQPSSNDQQEQPR